MTARNSWSKKELMGGVETGFFSIGSLKRQNLPEVLKLLSLYPGIFNDKILSAATEEIQRALHPNDTESQYFVARHKIGRNRIIGVIGYDLTEPCAKVYYLGWFAVDPEYQRRGIGRALLEKVETDLKNRGGRLFLADTLDGGENSPVKRFYEACGFLKGGFVPDYWAPGEDLTMFYKKIS